MSWTPPSPPAGDSARETRVSKLVALELSSDRYRRAKIVVRNLSPHGLGVRGDIELLPTEQVIVHLPDGRNVVAIVRWAKKNTFGLSLSERIEPEQLQPRAAPSAVIVPRDAELGFNRLRHQASSSRTGFQRTHKDDVLHTSNWRSER